MLLAVGVFTTVESASTPTADARATSSTDFRELEQRAWLIHWRASDGPWARASSGVSPAPPPVMRDYAVFEPAFAEALGIPREATSADRVGDEPRLLGVIIDDDPALETVQATVSFYYCENGGRWHPGDGGNFCGVMRNGTVVRPGAAACDYKYLGQRFRIIGDPLDRVYTCEDTGSAVHDEHRDIWFYNSDDGWLWQAQVGQHVTLEILP